MSDVKAWYTVRDSNSAASPDGAPESMNRSGVNDSMRELMASVKRFHDDPSFREPFEDYTLVRVTGTQFTLADGSVESDASALLEAGQRVRMVEGATTWEGEISDSPAAPNYSAPTTTFHVSWETPNATGPAVLPDSIFVHDKAIRPAAFRSLGTNAGSLVLYDDFADSAFIAQGTLNVGELGSKSMVELSQDAWRYRLNANGDLEHWQRGTSFDASTDQNNDANNVCADCVTMVSDGDDRIDVERSADAPTGAGLKYSMRCLAGSTSVHKFGVLVPVPREDAADYMESGSARKICGSFYAKLDAGATGIDTLRAYLLNIKVETPTVAPVSSWANGSTGTDFVPNSAEWEIIASAQIDLTSSWQRFTPSELTDVAVPSGGAGGVALMIVADETTFTAGQAFFLAGLQVSAGEAQLDFVRAPSAVEWVRCLRHYRKTAGVAVMPGDGAAAADVISVSTNGSGEGVFIWSHPVPMWKTPTVVPYAPSGGTAGQWYDGVGVSVAPLIQSTQQHSKCFLLGGTADDTFGLGLVAHANVWGAN